MDFVDELVSLFVVDANDGTKCSIFESMNLEQVPIDGIVQPPTVPSDEKPHRNTNALQYVLNVLKIVSRHRHAWPFKTPVDTVKSSCPDYYTIIKYPMDLTTVKKRIENFYYYDVKECIKDVQMIFYNCYKYNKPSTDIVIMCQNIEKLFVKKMADCPKEEKEIPMDIKPDLKTTKQKSVKTAAHKNVDADTGFPRDSFTPFQNSTPYLTASSSKAQSGIKRKANMPPAHSPVNVISPIAPLNKVPKMSQNTSLHSKVLCERQVHNLSNNSSNPMEYCHAILGELLSSKHAWLFYNPVDPKLLDCPDYYDVIKKPMDLGTVRDKLKNNIYRSPSEFASDIRLIFTNCYKYNLPEDEVVQHANQLRGVFEILYAKMPESVETVLPKKPTKIPHSDRPSSGKENLDFSLSVERIQQKLQKLSEQAKSLSQKKSKKSRKSDPAKCASSNEMGDVDVLNLTPLALPSPSTSIPVARVGGRPSRLSFSSPIHSSSPPSATESFRNIPDFPEYVLNLSSSSSDSEDSGDALKDVEDCGDKGSGAQDAQKVGSSSPTGSGSSSSTGSGSSSSTGSGSSSPSHSGNSLPNGRPSNKDKSGSGSSSSSHSGNSSPSSSHSSSSSGSGSSSNGSCSSSGSSSPSSDGKSGSGSSSHNSSSSKSSDSNDSETDTVSVFY